MTLQLNPTGWLGWLKLGAWLAGLIGSALTAWLTLNANVNSTAAEVSGARKDLAALTASIGTMREDLAALRATAPVRAAAVDHRLDEVERRVTRLEDGRRRAEVPAGICAAPDCPN